MDIRERFDEAIEVLRQVHEHCMGIEYIPSDEDGTEYGRCIGCVFGTDACHCAPADVIDEILGNGGSPADWRFKKG